MDGTEQKPLPKQVCTIRVMFPVESDEQALSVKKKIDNALLDILNARLDFGLTTAATPRTPALS